MLDDFSRFQESTSRGIEGLGALLRLVGAIITRPRRLLALLVCFALFGAVVSLRDGWLMPVAIVLLIAALAIWRYGE